MKLDAATLAVLITAIVGAITGLGTYWKTRKSDREARGKSGQEALNNGFKVLIDDYQERVAEVRTQYEVDLQRLRDAHESELERMHKRYDQELDDCNKLREQYRMQIEVLEEQIRDERSEHKEMVEQLKREFAVRWMLDDKPKEE